MQFKHKQLEELAATNGCSFIYASFNGRSITGQRAVFQKTENGNSQTIGEFRCISHGEFEDTIWETADPEKERPKNPTFLDLALDACKAQVEEKKNQQINA